MMWTTPLFQEIRMDAEAGSYFEDYGAPTGRAPEAPRPAGDDAASGASEPAGPR